MNSKPQILLTNDDGIRSPGLWAAAAALSRIGFVHVAAPRVQYSGAGRSMPSYSDGRIEPLQVTVNGKQWTVHSVGGTPAQTVLHAVIEIMPACPDLVVSGINYGENVGSGVTISGTVGAALEAAALGAKAIAISLETELEHHLSYSEDVDFNAAAHFAAYFGSLLLAKEMPDDVDVLKVEVPSDATVDSPWEMTRLSRKRYFDPVKPKRTAWDQKGWIGYRMAGGLEQDDPDSDIYAIRFKRVVSVTPLSLDLTSRISLKELDELLRSE